MRGGAGAGDPIPLPLSDRPPGEIKPTGAESAASPDSIWIPGTPSVWGTKAEAPWRATLAEHIPLPEGTNAIGVRLEFTLSSMERAGQPFDLDNLCEPVFRVLVNGRGYFAGRRPEVKWWTASKRIETPAGCRIHLGSKPALDALAGRVVFQDTFRGAFPSSAGDRASLP